MIKTESVDLITDLFTRAGGETFIYITVSFCGVCHVNHFLQCPIKETSQKLGEAHKKQGQTVNKRATGRQREKVTDI